MAGFSVPYFTFEYNGAPASGGSVYVYQTGTTTLVPIYSNAALTSPLNNPATLDINGGIEFYVGSTINIRMDAYNAAGAFAQSIDPVYVIPDLTGLSSLTSLSFGGYVNKFRNGTMDIWQRGTSGTITAGTPAYTADGWIVGSTGANVSWARQNVNTNGCTYCLNIAGNTSVTDTFIKQRIEGAIAQQLYTGANVTVQAIIYNNSGGVLTPTITIKHATALDSWASTVTDVSAQSLQSIANSTNGLVAYTFSPSSSSGNGLEITFDFGSSLNASTKSINFFSLDIRVTQGSSVGINSNPPIPELRPYPTELAYCQRYFYALNYILNQVIGYGISTSTTTWEIGIPLPVTMRMVPSASLPSAGSLQANFQNCSSVAVSNGNQSSQDIFTISGTNSSGLIAGGGVGLRWISSGGSGSFQFSSEL